MKELTALELNNEKFESYFLRYLGAIDACKANIIPATNIDLNKPRTESDKHYKCSNCIYKKIHICEE